MTLWVLDFLSRKWTCSWWSPTTRSKSIPYLISPSQFCEPSTLYIVIGFCSGTSSSPTLLTQSKSMIQLVHPELTRALTPAHCTVVSVSKCTWMESLHFLHFGFSSEILIVTSGVSGLLMTLFSVVVFLPSVVSSL